VLGSKNNSDHKKLIRIEREVDSGTGEIYSSKQSYREPPFNEDGYKVPHHKLGAKLFGCVSFPNDMTDNEIGKMTRLARLMIPMSNMLGYKARGCIHPYTEKHIYSAVGLSERRGRPFLKKMIRLGVVQGVKREEFNHTEYYINPAYFFAGRRIGFNLYLLFREHLDPILPRWVKAEFMKMVDSFSLNLEEDK